MFIEEHISYENIESNATRFDVCFTTERVEK